MLYFNYMSNKNRFAFFILIFALIFNLSAAYGDYAAGKILVKFKPGIIKIPKGLRIAGVKASSVSAASVRALNGKHGVFEIEQLYKKVLEIRPDWTHLADEYVLVFSKEKDVKKVFQDYKKDPNVVSASAVSKVYAFSTLPNDPYFAQQYGLTNIRAPQAWDRSTGSSSTIVAVLDTGVNHTHEDFQGRINLANAWDFVNNDSDPMDDHPARHGTAVAGIIGAVTDNGKGIAGVDWQAKILPIKVLDGKGEGSMDDILQGIAWARAKSADVINMSFGQYNLGVNKYTEENPSGIKDRCLEAFNDGIVLVAASGNGNVDWNTYPAYYSTVIAVAAVDQNDQRAVWGTQASNYGSWINASAPGDSIWSVFKGSSNYAVNNGTSFASPFVAGLAALLKAVNPGLTSRQIIDTITAEADDIDSLNPGFEGKLGKRINAYLAAAGVVAKITSPESSSYVKGKIDIYGSASGWDFSSYEVEVLKTGAPVATLKTSAASVEGGILGSWDTTGYNGEYIIRLKVSAKGSNSLEADVAVFVDNITPEANITSPVQSGYIQGKISVIGSAKDQYLDWYVLEYGRGAAPSVYEKIKKSYVSVDTGVLATWETSGLEGVYTLRLTVNDKVKTSTTQSITINILSSGAVAKQAEPQDSLPLAFALPNPFDPSRDGNMAFSYSLKGNFYTSIYLFDLSGSLIWQKNYSAGENGGKSGENNPSWDGIDLYGEMVRNGVYLYQIVADKRVIARGKLVVLN
jgi:subtilisin family serine protease